MRDSSRSNNSESLPRLAILCARHGTSWSILSLLLHGREVDSQRELLTHRYFASGFLDEIRAMALALLALGGRVESFRV